LNYQLPQCWDEDTYPARTPYEPGIRLLPVPILHHALDIAAVFYTLDAAYSD